MKSSSSSRLRARLGSVLLGLVLLAGCDLARARRDAPLTYVERVLNAEPNAKLPLLIAVHGLGDTPERFIALFEQLGVPVRIIAPRAPDPFSEGSSWFAIDDPKRAPGGILKRAELLTQLADELRQSRPTVGLPLITGFSQGGILSFAVSAYHAEHFSAALPIAGSLLDSLAAYHRAPPNFRVVAFHGMADPRIPYDGAQRTVLRLEKVGTQVALKGYPGVGHELPPALVADWFAALRSQLESAR